MNLPQLGYTEILILGLLLVPILLLIIGFGIRPKYKKAGKIFIILATIFLILGLGFCGSRMVY